jgi:hypothetical protein
MVRRAGQVRRLGLLDRGDGGGIASPVWAILGGDRASRASVAGRGGPRRALRDKRAGQQDREQDGAAHAARSAIARRSRKLGEIFMT